MTNAIAKTNTKTRKNAKASTPVRVATIVLKTLYNDICKSNARFADTHDTKKMRVMLRKNYAHIHDHNNAWIFTQNEYDEIRSRYDEKYAQSIARKAKTSTRVTKAKTQSIDTPIVATKDDTQLIDA